VGVRGRPHTLGNVAPVLAGKTGLEDFFAWMRRNFDPTVTWKDLEWVRSRWRGPLIVKGILDAEDARQVADLGADGIVVSNHGGRQLDGTPSTTRVLPAIAAAVGDRLAVLADGGIRSGLDVVRMLSLGARGVLIGRAWVYALAAHGQQGVAHALALIEAEMRVALSLTGCVRIQDLAEGSLFQEF
jgi:L-lactate dehydrogenase (cytochrome)